MKRSLAYITAAWRGDPAVDMEQAAHYCRVVYDAGYSPICPMLYLPLFLNDAVPEEHKNGIDMGRDLLRRSHVLVVCGHTMTEAMKNDIAVAQRLGITATTLEGILTVKGQGKGIRTEKGEFNRWIKATNAVIKDIRKKISLLFDWITEIKAELAKPQTPDLVSLLNDYYTQRKAGAYSQKGKISNLKEMNETYNYLRANGIYTLEDLESRLQSHRTTVDGLKTTMDSQNARMKAIRRDIPLTLADERIARAIRENNAKLVIIDPVQAFLGADVDMNRANEVRPIFRSLGDIAQATGCAIVLIGHLNKAAGTQSTYRGLGSIDITAAVRSLLFIGKLKDNPTTRVLIHEKSSLAPPGQSLAFSLGDEKGFEWIGAYDITADELLAGTDTAKTESKTAQAEMLILELLANGKKMPSAELEKAVNDRGISSRTMRTAKSRIGDRLITEKDGTAWVCYLRN